MRQLKITKSITNHVLLRQDLIAKLIIPQIILVGKHQIKDLNVKTKIVEVVKYIKYLDQN
jgi:hypothetical protein